MDRVWKMGTMVNKNSSTYANRLSASWLNPDQNREPYTGSESKQFVQDEIDDTNEKIERVVYLLHKTIKKVGEDIEKLQYNTAISALMILLNEFEEKKEMVDRDDMSIFLKLLAPFVPHITEELWQSNGFSSLKKWQSIHREPWPVYEKKYLREDTREFAIQINGKLRDTFTAPSHIGEQEAIRLTLEREKVKIFLAGRDPKKVIFVPGRLINIVV